jgi:hypothetical protein
VVASNNPRGLDSLSHGIPWDEWSHAEIPTPQQVEGEVVKKLVLCAAAAAAVAAPLALIPSVAGATGGTSTGSSLSIKSTADYDFVGTTIDVGLQVRCSGGSGSVIVDLSQAPPETPYPVGAGSGPQIVVCDGQSHGVAVTVAGVGFDAGKAKATATLTALSGNVTKSSWVTIVQ